MLSLGLVLPSLVALSFRGARSLFLVALVAGLVAGVTPAGAQDAFDDQISSAQAEVEAAQAARRADQRSPTCGSSPSRWHDAQASNRGALPSWHSAPAHDA